MKKIALIGIVILSVVLSGCAREETEVANPALVKAAYEAEAEVSIIQDRIRDDSLWKSVYREADLIEETIDDGKLASVSFKLSTLEGETIILEDLYTFRLVDSDDVWRKLTVSQIIYALVTSDEITEAEANGETLTVDGVILKWTDYNLETSRTASVCDSDGDGHWDHLCEGRMYFTTASSATVVPADESGYGIGNTSIENPRVYGVDGGAKLSDFTESIFN